MLEERFILWYNAITNEITLHSIKVSYLLAYITDSGDEISIIGEL